MVGEKMKIKTTISRNLPGRIRRKVKGRDSSSKITENAIIPF